MPRARQGANDARLRTWQMTGMPKAAHTSMSSRCARSRAGERCTQSRDEQAQGGEDGDEGAAYGERCVHSGSPEIERSGEP